MNEEYKKDISKLIRWSLVLVFMLTAFLAMQTVNAIKEYGTIGRDMYPTKTLSVTGEGEVQALPDVAQFTFSITEEEDTVSSAQEAVTEKIDAALAALAEVGVEEKDIKTTSYNAYPRYSYPEILCISGNCPPRERVLSGYEVSQTISVKVRDTEKAGEALQKVAAAGISNVSGLQFVIDDEDVLREEARTQAIADAKEKIAQLADDLGVRVKGVVSFSEDFGQPYAMYDRAVSSSLGFGGDTEEFKAPSLPIGENTVRVHVYVTYEIK